MPNNKFVQSCKIVYKAWMKFANALGWVNTRVILTVVYFLVITPLALLFRLIGKGPMSRRLSGAKTFWIKRVAKSFDHATYRRQF